VISRRNAVLSQISEKESYDLEWYYYIQITLIEYDPFNQYEDGVSDYSSEAWQIAQWRAARSPKFVTRRDIERAFYGLDQIMVDRLEKRLVNLQQNII
jgi:hypothetical protein